METSLHSSTVYKKLHTNLAGFFIAMSIVCLVVLVMDLFIGEQKLPRAIRGTNPYFFLGALLFAAPAIYIWVVKKIKIEIYKMGNILCVDVADPVEPIQLKFPFTVHAQWFNVPAPKGPDMKELYVTFAIPRAINYSRSNIPWATSTARPVILPSLIYLGKIPTGPNPS